jgi:hypothetical protein
VPWALYGQDLGTLFRHRTRETLWLAR